jgi:hypothetical protein
MADSFLGEELLTETNHEILQHLEACPVCRADIDARRRLRGALQKAFKQAPDLQPRPEFTGRLRDQLREAAAHERRPWILPRGWLALAASIVVATGLVAALFFSRATVQLDALAQAAIGDHRNCALKFRLASKPISLEEAAQRFDRAYRLLLTAPPDDIVTPAGTAHVLERHSCVYADRRFGHVVMRYHGRVVSLLMTEAAQGPGDAADSTSHLTERSLNGLSVVSVAGSHHAILLVSDLERGELAQLSKAVSIPLAERLEGGLIPADHSTLAEVRDRADSPSRINTVNTSTR